jgi:hypothetical protein
MKQKLICIGRNKLQHNMNAVDMHSSRALISNDSRFFLVTPGMQLGDLVQLVYLMQEITANT